MVPIKLGCFELYLIKNNGGFLLLNYAVKAKTSMIGQQNTKTFFSVHLRWKQRNSRTNKQTKRFNSIKNKNRGLANISVIGWKQAENRLFQRQRSEMTFSLS